MASPKKPSGPGYEKRDADFKNLMLTGIGLLGIMVVGMILSWVVYVIAADHTPAPGAPTETFAVPDSAKLPPLPNLEVNSRIALLALMAKEDSMLGSYGWVDKEAGIVRVPIDRAIELLVAKGLPYEERKK